MHGLFVPRRLLVALVATGLLACVPVEAFAQTAAVLFQRAQTREAAARKSGDLAALRAAVTAYETVVRRHPRSGYCDDALWNGAELARFAFEKHGNAADRTTAERLYNWLRKEYPASAKARPAAAQVTALASAQKPPASAPTRPAAPAPATPPPTPAAAPPPAATPPASTAAPAATAALRNVTVTPLPKGDRITLEFDREVLFTSERLTDPDRVFFDMKQADYVAAVSAATEQLSGTRVRTVRLGKQAGNQARIVLELAGTPSHSSFVLYHPFRLVIDIESEVTPPPAPSAPAAPSTPPPAPAPAPVTPTPTRPAVADTTRPTPPPASTSPAPSIAPASTTSGGDYTLARQLGLGVSRVVIDPGHGGHDPGAKANGIDEAALVLDVALRVEAILKKAGVEVVLTRRTNVFIPLEERTAIANREDADLFLSIHANAAARLTARGVETYFLNFATNPEAEAVAARENATSGKSMGNLPKLVQQITLNTKVKESREFAQMVQTSMIRGLRPLNKTVMDLGVKQAPFVVLIGAQMPSVLAEISFITNKSEATLLKRDNYKQRIAQSLADAVLKYQASLKKSTGIVATAK